MNETRLELPSGSLPSFTHMVAPLGRRACAITQFLAHTAGPA